jgi:hypothetical protein
MNKKLYKFFLVTILSSVLFVSCKKSTDNVNPGISYGITGVEPAMAGSGDTVKIYGVGFQSGTTANTVKINGIAAKVISASTSELDVVVPDAPSSGNVSVQTGANTFTYTQTFNVANVLSGNQAVSTTLVSNRLYLLRGAVHFTKGAVLTIPAGTIILANRATNASLIIDDGASVLMNGTANQPIVFTSDQQINLRNPGDWQGITLAASTATASDVLKYVRIEYAGYHLSNAPGAALLINRDIANGNLQYIQATYSSGDGFRSAGNTGTTLYLKYLVSYGCAGNDFDFAGASVVKAQFLLGLKDPNYADQYGADGLLVQSTQPVTVSNLTLMGPAGLSRNTLINQPNYNYYPPRNWDDILNAAAGRGVHIGGYDFVSQKPINARLQLYNSVIAAPWLAGISVDGPLAWANYGNAATGSIIKNSFVTYNLATDQNTINHYDPPLRGYSFSSENLSNSVSGFLSSDNTAQGASFNASNDTVQLQLLTPFVSAVNPNQKYDDLGITNLALYSRIAAPVMSPATGSELLTGAAFTDSPLSDTFFDRSQPFRGAFGTSDWTKSWSNYVPQQTPYN